MPLQGRANIQLPLLLESDSNIVSERRFVLCGNLCQKQQCLRLETGVSREQRFILSLNKRAAWFGDPLHFAACYYSRSLLTFFMRT